MEAHYTRFEWVPLKEPQIRYDRSTKISGDVAYFSHDFEVIDEGEEGAMPALTTVVQYEDQYSVDWEIYAQLRNESFETFLKEQITEPMSFRVLAVRGVPLGKEEELPLEGGVERLRVRWRPNIPEAVSVYAGKSTAAGVSMAKLTSWNTYRPFRIEVKWNSADDVSYIELTNLEIINFRTPSVVDNDLEP